ncbi:MAG: serine O-acetyltransferase EpsC [Bacillota bacterium]|nr:serine O-acetyltransferase EpsC [Bacillota bacterium]
MFKYFKSIKDRDPAARNYITILFTYPCVHAIFWHRIAHFLYKSKFYFLARVISQISRWFTLIEIHPGAKIGKNLLIDHGCGVIIGETTEIGDNCTIYQGVTLGGTGKHVGKRHPTIGDNVLIGAGAKVLGPFKVGNNSKIAANAVVLSEVPDDCTCVGVPGRIVRRGNKKVVDMDQIHIPDPVSQEFCRMEMQINELREAIRKITEEHR